jgi:hypothetical protein
MISVVRRMRVSIGLTLLLLFSHTVPAQEHPTSLLEKGTWDISPWIAAATGEENRNSFGEAQVWSAGVFLGRVMSGGNWLRGNLEYGFNLVPLFVTSKTEHVYGGGIEPVVLRWISNRHFGRIAPYIELAGGAIRTTANLPVGDTSAFNFTARGGGGIHIFGKRRRSLDLACHWYHISNANLGVRNPEFNGVQITIGYHWFK